jgi:enoyl-CoA hydratase
MRTDFEAIKIIQEGRVVHLVLNRPEKRNAISHQMQAEIDLALNEAEVDPNVGAVVLRGEGKLFTAGHDLGEHSSGKSFPALTFPNASPSVHPHFPRAWYFRKPLIGAIHNFVGAYGIALVACCDFTIAGEGTRISGEIFRGGYPDIGWLPLYAQLPLRVMEKFWLMGGWMDAEQALQFQFVQRVLPEDEVVGEAVRWAQQASLVPSARFGYAKDKIRRSFELMGLSSLASVLDPHHVLPADEIPTGGFDFDAAIKEVGLAEAVKRRDAAFDPAISRV